MDEDWQLEAIHQQFDVFQSLKQSYKNIQINNLTCLVKEIDLIKRRNLSVNRTNLKTTPEICDTIVKNHTSDEQTLKLSFVVIVTNILNNGRLCKYPVIALMANNEKVFLYVDMNCNVHKTWTSVLKYTDLPSCEFCFPCDGLYMMGKHLKVDFAKSPLAQGIPTKVLEFVGGVVVSTGLMVFSFFYKIPQSVFKGMESLTSVATKFAPTMVDIFRSTLPLILLVSRYNGSVEQSLLIVSEAYKIFTCISTKYNEERNTLWEHLKKAFWQVYDWLYKKLSRFFELSSKYAQHSFLAVTNRIDGLIIILRRNAQKVMALIWKRNEEYDENPATDSNITTDLPETPAVTVDNSSIFKNCINECTLKGMPGKGRPVDSFTEKLLDISIDVSNDPESLSKLQDTFESINIVWMEVFTHDFNNYTRSLKAAQAAAGHAIDINAFNKTFGINGDPTNYFSDVALSRVNELYFNSKIQKEIIEIKRKQKVLLIPINSNKEQVSLYKGRGIQGQGEMTADQIIDALKEHEEHLSFRKNDYVVTQTLSLIVIRSEKKYHVIVYQEKTEENTFEGYVHVQKINV